MVNSRVAGMALEVNGTLRGAFQGSILTGKRALLSRRPPSRAAHDNTPIADFVGWCDARDLLRCSFRETILMPYSSSPLDRFSRWIGIDSVT